MRKLELDLKKDQDVGAKGKDIDECLVVLRAAAGRLAPDAESRVAFRKQEAVVRDLAIRVRCIPTRSCAELALVHNAVRAAVGGRKRKAKPKKRNRRKRPRPSLHGVDARL